MATMILFRFLVLFFLACGLSGTLVACAPTLANRGQIVEEEKVSEVKVGTSSREDVARLLGSPTQIGTFDEKVWYYVGRNTKQYAFFDPEVVEHKAVEVRFDEEGIVSSVASLDSANVRAIEPVSRRTPTHGHETTILEQLVGNLGRPSGLAGREAKK